MGNFSTTVANAWVVCLMMLIVSPPSLIVLPNTSTTDETVCHAHLAETKESYLYYTMVALNWMNEMLVHVGRQFSKNETVLVLTEPP